MPDQHLHFLGGQEMATTYVIFDKRSGRILSVHHGAIDAKEARTSAQHHRHDDAKISDEHIEVIPIPSDPLDHEKLYKVDVDRKVLVATTARAGGVAFSFGEVGQSSGGRG
jgi:hypothetical protein